MSGATLAVAREAHNGPGVGRMYNFPAQVTSLVGRERQIADACAALTAPYTRLLTVTGPPGVGKTRLAMGVAAEIASRFADGAYFVPLAALSDPGLVVTAIGQVLGMKEAGKQALIVRLKAFLGDKELLLVLDNFEQVLPAAPLLGELLGAAPGLKIIVTSRALLRVYGEHDFRLLPLDLPDLDSSNNLGVIAQNDAVQLFRQRAQAARPDFKLTEGNTRDVAEICVRLAGLPLAIELAAARTRLLTPSNILSNLKGQGRRLAFLRGGAQDLPARQQTLRSAIEWSYNLLDEEEKTLLRRLAVFVGSCTIEAIEAICSPTDDLLLIGGPAPNDAMAILAQSAIQSHHSAHVLDNLTSLVDKSLLRQEEAPGAEVRFSMLEMIREYLLEQLEESGEAAEFRDRHAIYYAQLVGFIERELLGEACAQQVTYLGLLEREHDNLRAALDWCRYRLSTPTPEGENTAKGVGGIDWHELALNMAGRLWVFWERHGHLSQGFRQISSVLDFGQPGPTQGHAAALLGVGRMLMWQDPEAARPYLEKGLELGRQLGDLRYVAMVLVALGHTLTMTGDLQPARAYLEEALAIRRPLGHLLGISSALDSLGRVAFYMGEYPEAEALFKEGLEIGRQAGDICSMAFCLHGLGQVAQSQRDFEQSRSYLMQSIILRQEYRDRRGIIDSLLSLVDVLTMQGDYEQATRLAGMAEVVCEAIGADLHLIDRVEHEHSLEMLRDRIGPEQFSRLWAEGRHLSVEQVLEQENTLSPNRNSTSFEATSHILSSNDPAGLTPRELEVLRAIATGMTNVQAADTLSISPHTVNMHVRSIFAKLGVTSRSAATRYAIVNRLI